MNKQTKKFSEIIVLKRGYDLPSVNRCKGSIPLYSSSGIADFVDEAKVTGPGVITGRSGSIGEVYYSQDDFWPLNTTLYVEDFRGNSPKYIYYWLSQLPLKQFATGSAVPTLNRNFLSDLECQVHSKEDQQHIVGTIGSVDDLIENIESRKRCLNSILETSLKRYSSCVPFQSYHPILVKTGISPFDGDKVYLDTSCVSGTDPTDYSYIVQYGERPSRANMQPSPRTAWTARMKTSFKVLGFTELDSFILNNVILSTGFVGVQESENLPLPFLYALFISKDFRAKKDLSSTGATMESINNKDFLDLMVPSLTLDEAREYKRKYNPIMLELSSLRVQEEKLKKEKKLLLSKYF